MLLRFAMSTVAAPKIYQGSLALPCHHVQLADHQEQLRRASSCHHKCAVQRFRTSEQDVVVCGQCTLSPRPQGNVKEWSDYELLSVETPQEKAGQTCL